MKLTLGEVANYLGSTSASPERVAWGYSIDSRTIAPEQLYFAIRGPRFDGHQFVAAVLNRGAAGAVVEQTFYAAAPAEFRLALIPVVDTLAALQSLAHSVRHRWGGIVVAITGSAGKSTTKEMTAALLKEHGSRVMRSPGNLNNDFGLPLALLGLRRGHGVAVVELGMSAAGEIARLAKIAAPDVGVVTNVAAAHLQFFDSVDAIARAKRELIDYLAETVTKPVAVLNEDDERVRRFGDGFPGRVLTFGFSPNAEVRATAVNVDGPERLKMEVRTPEWTEVFALPLAGKHNVMNALAAIAASSIWQVSPPEIRSALASFQNLHQRSEVLTLPGDVTIINDCYNSNPLAMERMLEALADWPGARRRIVVAGEMLELGPAAPELHRAVGRKCAQSGVEWALGVQGAAEFFVEGAMEGGIAESKAKFFADAKSAGEFCLSLIAPGDVVLVKGSRGVHLETVIEMLKGRGAGVRSPETESKHEN